MRVTIIAPPRGEVDGVRLSKYQVGRTYDVPTAIGCVLILERYARVEMRLGNRRRTSRPETGADRRKPTRLVIVRRGEDALFRLFEQNFGNPPAVCIIWDRRREERRRTITTVRKDRRREERRAPQLWPASNYLVVDIARDREE